MAEERLAQVEGLLIIQEYDRSYIIESGDGKRHSLAKSQVANTEPEGIGETYTFTIAEWLAKKLGLI